MKFTNHHNLSDEIVKAITTDSYDYPTDSKTIPCSTLISPPRISILSKRHDNEIIKDVSEDVWALFGQAIHYILAKQGNSTAIIEKRIKIPYKGYFISGKPDYFDPIPGHLKDLKVTSVFKYIFGPKDGFREWTEQLNVYAWLLRMQGQEVNKITVTAILRDWQQREAMRNAEYPDVQIKDIGLDLWSVEKQEEFISSKLIALVENDTKKDNDLDACTPSERWASPTTYRIEKEGRKTAVRVLDTMEEAEEYIKEKGTKEMSIVKREGEDKRCSNYCNVSGFCQYFRSKNGT